MIENIVVRMRETVVLRGRLLTKYGQFGSLVALAPVDALRLLEAGLVKLPAGMGLTRHMLRQRCERLAV